MTTEDIKFIRLAEVLALVPVSESTLYRMVARDEFPKSLKLGGNVAVWVESQVKAWMLQQVSDCQKDDLI